MPWHRLHNGSLTTVIWRWLGELYITHFQFSLVKNIFADAVLRRAGPTRDHHRVIGASLRLTSHWRRPCGRPRTSWMGAIDTDVQSVNIGIQSAWRKAGDRTIWWHVVDTTILPSWGTCHWREFCRIVSSDFYLPFVNFSHSPFIAIRRLSRRSKQMHTEYLSWCLYHTLAR